MRSLKKAVKTIKEKGIVEGDFNRIKKTIYGDYIKKNIMMLQILLECFY